MKIRLMVLISALYIVISSILVPLFLGLGYLVYVNLGQSINIRSVLEYVAHFYSMLKYSLLDINKFRLAETAITVFLLLTGAYFVSAGFNRQYVSLCRVIDDMRSGDYSIKSVKGSYYPEMSHKLKELSMALDKHKQKKETEKNERDSVINDAVEQLQKALAGAKGKMEVVIETGTLEKASQERIMLASVLESMTEMENIIDSLRE